MGDPTAPKYCYKHPKEETGLSCGRCERPICTRCVVIGPAGPRCRECASLRGTHLYQVSIGRLLLTIVTALVVGAGGALLLLIGSCFIFFIGPAVGEAQVRAVRWASGRKQGPLIDGIAIGGLIVGALPIILVELHTFGFRGIYAIAWPAIGEVLAISTCIARLKYY